MTVEKPKPKQLLRPITTGAGSAMNQSQFLASTCNSLEAREKSRVHGAIGFGFASHWLKNWRESFKPITNHVITFDSHLKTALTLQSMINIALLCSYFRVPTEQEGPRVLAAPLEFLDPEVLRERRANQGVLANL